MAPPPPPSSAWAGMDDEKERGRRCTVRRKVKIPLQWASSKPEVIAGSWELSAAVSVDTQNCLSPAQPKGSIYMYRLQIQKASSVFSRQKNWLKNTAKEENELCFFQACPLNTERAQKRKNQVRYLDMHCFVCIAHISEKHAIVSGRATHLQSVALCSSGYEWGWRLCSWKHYSELQVYQIHMF